MTIEKKEVCFEMPSDLWTWFDSRSGAMAKNLLEAAKGFKKSKQSKCGAEENPVERSRQEACVHHACYEIQLLLSLLPEKLGKHKKEGRTIMQGLSVALHNCIRNLIEFLVTENRLRTTFHVTYIVPKNEWLMMITETGIDAPFLESEQKRIAQRVNHITEHRLADSPDNIVNHFSITEKLLPMIEGFMTYAGKVAPTDQNFVDADKALKMFIARREELRPLAERVYVENQKGAATRVEQHAKSIRSQN